MNTTRHQLLSTALVLLSALTVHVRSGRAATVAELSLDQLRDAASLVVTGEIVRTESYWDDGVILTDSLIAVDDCVLGDCPEVVWVTTIGGVVDDIAQRIQGAAVYAPGDQVLVFLEPAGGDRLRTVGMAQGCFHVRRVDGQFVAESDRSGLVLMDGRQVNAEAPTRLAFQLPELVDALRMATPAQPLR